MLKIFRTSLSSLVTLAILIFGNFTANAITEPVTKQEIDPYQAAYELKNSLFNYQLQLKDFQPISDLNLLSTQNSSKLKAQINQAGSNKAELEFAYYRGLIWTEILNEAYQNTRAAIINKDSFVFKNWSNIREYKTATRLSSPTAETHLAFTDYLAGKKNEKETLNAIDIDFLSSYQEQLNNSLKTALQNIEKKFWSSAAYEIGLSKGYFTLISDKFRNHAGEQKFQELNNKLLQLEQQIQQKNLNNLAANIIEIQKLLENFQAVPLSETELKDRIGLMVTFLELVPIEYNRGVRNGEIVHPIEIQEAVSFTEAAHNAYRETKFYFSKKDPTSAENLSKIFKNSELLLNQANNNQKISEPDIIKQQIEQILTTIKQLTPEDWLKSDSANIKIVYTLLMQVSEAVSKGDYKQAELSRLEAYGLFDAYIELKLMAFNPALVAKIDGLFWHGYEDETGLATALAKNSDETTIKQTIATIKKELKNAEKIIGSDQKPLSVIINTAVIVFREGLEAIFIVFALLASLNLNKNSATTNTVYKRPLIWGVFAGLIVSVLTWIIAQQIISQFTIFGEKLEAVISLIAIAVLLLITNWFFHNIYWTDWQKKLHKRKYKLLKTTNTANTEANTEEFSNNAKLFGFFLLGLTSVYREGFETVLFLQVFVLNSGVLLVMQGFLIGTFFLSLVGILTFYLQRKLPYLKMLVLTGFLIVTVLIIMVGQTVHTVQAIGWIGITPIEFVKIPYWAGHWFGLYATWESILLQLASLIFVGGSYLIAEHFNNQKEGKTKISLWQKLRG